MRPVYMISGGITKFAKAHRNKDFRLMVKEAYDYALQDIPGLTKDKIDGAVGSYFSGTASIRYEVTGSYAAPDVGESHECFGWSHGISETLAVLARAGLELEFFREHPFSPYDCFPFFEEDEPGRYVVRGPSSGLPLVFSVRARRPETDPPG